MKKILLFENVRTLFVFILVYNARNPSKKSHIWFWHSWIKPWNNYFTLYFESYIINFLFVCFFCRVSFFKLTFDLLRLSSLGFWLFKRKILLYVSMFDFKNIFVSKLCTVASILIRNTITITIHECILHVSYLFQNLKNAVQCKRTCSTVVLYRTSQYLHFAW